MALTSAALLGVLLASMEHPYAKDCQHVLREAVRVAKPCTTHSDKAGTYATIMAAEQHTGQCHAVKMSILLREGRAIRSRARMRGTRCTWPSVYGLAISDFAGVSSMP